jgi:hypothetical protein
VGYYDKADELRDTNSRMNSYSDIIRGVRSEDLAPADLDEVKAIHAMQDIPAPDRMEKIATLLMTKGYAKRREDKGKVLDYPFEKPPAHEEAVQAQVAQSPHIDPMDALVQAVIARESGGNPDAIGKAGEVGLMQIHPDTAKDYGVSLEDLRSAGLNKAVGSHKLGSLLHKYNGDIEKALQAYNGGPRHVDEGNVSSDVQAYARDVMETFRNLVGGGQAQAAEPPAAPQVNDAVLREEPQAPQPIPNADPNQSADMQFAAQPAQAPQAPQAPPQAQGSPPGVYGKIEGPGGNPPSAAPTPSAPFTDEAWSAMLAKVQPQGAPANESLPQHIGRSYRENVAQPGTELLTKGLKAAAPYVPSALKPFEAESVAKFVVPQTATQAAIDAAGMLLPPVRGISVAGRAGAGMLERALTNPLGHIAAQTGIGATAGALTGEGAGQGAFMGGVGSTVGQLVRGGTGMAGRWIGKNVLADDYSKGITDYIGKILPGVKLRSANEMYDFFRPGGEGEQAAGRLLTNTKREIASQLPTGARFVLPVFDGVSDTGQPITHNKVLSFEEADDLLTYYGNIVYGITMDKKDTKIAPYVDDLAFKAKMSLLNQLEKWLPGSGFTYRNARKTFATTKALTHLTQEPGVFDLETGQLSQPGLSDAFGKGEYYKKFKNALMDPKDANAFVNQIGRGYRGAGQDIAAQSMGIRSATVGGLGHGTLSPRFHPHLGSTARPVGTLPWWANPAQGRITKSIPDLLGQGIMNEYTGEKK